VKANLDGLLQECQSPNITREKLKYLQDKLHEIEGEIIHKESYKWYASIYIFIIIFFLFFFCFYPLFYYAATKLAPNSILKDAIISPEMIPSKLSNTRTIRDKRYFYTAWDIENRTPRFFSKYSADIWGAQTFDNNYDIGDMVLASMSSPEFVTPAVIAGTNKENDAYISGDNVAKSPAMFSYMFTKEVLKRQDIPEVDFTVVSIGSINNAPDSDAVAAYSLTDWATYLMTNNHDIVSHTQDYMLRTMMSKNSHTFHKFERNERSEWYNDVQFASNKTQHALDVAELIINENKAELDQVLNALITQKLGKYNSCFTDSCGLEYPKSGKVCTTGATPTYGRVCNNIANSAGEHEWKRGYEDQSSKWCQDHPVDM